MVSLVLRSDDDWTERQDWEVMASHIDALCLVVTHTRYGAAESVKCRIKQHNARSVSGESFTRKLVHHMCVPRGNFGLWCWISRQKARGDNTWLVCVFFERKINGKWRSPHGVRCIRIVEVVRVLSCPNPRCLAYPSLPPAVLSSIECVWRRGEGDILAWECVCLWSTRRKVLSCFRLALHVAAPSGENIPYPIVDIRYVFFYWSAICIADTKIVPKL